MAKNRYIIIASLVLAIVGALLLPLPDSPQTSYDETDTPVLVSTLAATRQACVAPALQASLVFVPAPVVRARYLFVRTTSDCLKPLLAALCIQLC
jgi:hypothetical protein